jgi:SAM-dependent methyltransferase
MSDEATPCPFCRSSQMTVLFEGINADAPQAPAIPLVHCRSCGSVVSTALFSAGPSKSETDYTDGYYGEQASSKGLNRLFIGLFQRERQKILTARRPGTILDVGCGDGTFLDFLPTGWRKFGYEPSSLGRRILERKNDISFYDFVAEPPIKQGFDVITFWQSLEHIPDPARALRTVKKILNEGGMLFISVPNFGSWQANFFGRCWFHLDPSRHYHHYTAATLKKLLAEEGFQIDHVGTLSFEYGVFGWLQSFLNMSPLEFNLVYKILKRKAPMSAHRWFGFSVCAALTVLLLPFSCLLTVLEAAFVSGAVLNIKASLKQG